MCYKVQNASIFIIGYIYFIYICFVTLEKSDDVIELPVGVILIDGQGAPYDRKRSASAIDIAFETVNRDILNSSYRLVKIDRKYGPKCDANVAPGEINNRIFCSIISISVTSPSENMFID